MNLFLFISFTAIFVASASCLVVSFLVFTSPEPWSVDEAANRALLGVSEGETFDQWFASFGEREANMRAFIQMFYTYAAIVTMCLCGCILLIIFLAHRNRSLITATHGLICGLLLILGWTLPELAFQQNSSHYPLFMMMLMSNALGLLCYEFDAQIWNRRDSKARPATSAASAPALPQQPPVGTIKAE